MKSILNQNIIDNYILAEFGDIPNPPTKDKMIRLINNNELTLEQVKLWSLFDGDLLIKGQYGNIILHSASYMGQLNIVEYVLDKGVDVDILNNYNSTPLMYASEKGYIKVINVLLDSGANINQQDIWGWSALHYACVWNKLEAIKVLVKRGVDIHLKGYLHNKDETALDIAKANGYQKIVNYLTSF